MVGVFNFDHACYQLSMLCVYELVLDETQLLGMVQCDFVYLDVL